jgi:hypothetical protein
MTPSRRAPLALALTLGLLLASGCSGDDRATDAGRDRAGDRAGATPTADPSPDATPSARPSERPRASVRPTDRRTVARQQPPPKPPGNALTVREAGPDGHLVSAADLGRAWRVTATEDEDGRVLSPCHRASLADVGATATRLRDFEARGDRPGTAVQAVSRFVDRKSAWRIERVVTSWATDCADALAERDAALGVVRHGTWLAVVEVAGVGHPRVRLARALEAADATF